MKTKLIFVGLIFLVIGIFIGMALNIQKNKQTIGDLRNKLRRYEIEINEMNSMINSMLTDESEINLDQNPASSDNSYFKPKQQELKHSRLEFKNKYQYVPNRIPVKKPIITKSYLPSKNHFGVDFAGRIGEDIYAAGSGVIKTITLNDTIYGKALSIDHLNGYSSFYGHNNKILVTKDKFVQKGDKIAEIGKTGNSSAPHLHFEIRYNESKINPMQVLK